MYKNFNKTQQNSCRYMGANLPSSPMQKSSGQKLLLYSMHRKRASTNTQMVTPPFSRER